MALMNGRSIEKFPLANSDGPCGGRDFELADGSPLRKARLLPGNLFMALLPNFPPLLLIESLLEKAGSGGPCRVYIDKKNTPLNSFNIRVSG